MFSPTGLAKSGLLVRHLAMPDMVQEGKEILSFLHSLSPDTYVNIMEQVRLHNNISLKNLTEIFTV